MSGVASIPAPLGDMLDAGRAFRSGSRSIEDLQSSISAGMSAIEGDVPAHVRDAAFRLEAKIDSARFTIGAVDRPAALAAYLREFEALVVDAFQHRADTDR